MPRTSGGPVPSGTGTISEITSTGGTITITDDTGPTTNLEVTTAAPAAATTVVGPDSFGASPAVGTGTHFARNDHDHGLPAAPADLPLAGGTMSGAIAMGTNKITGLGNGSGAQDAAALGQITAANAAALALAGGTMSGAIAMGTNKITGLGNGSGAQDAAAFGQIPVPGNGYGITGNTGATPTPAVSLTTAATATLASDTSIAAGAVTNLLSQTVAAGTWLLLFQLTAFQSVGALQVLAAQIGANSGSVTGIIKSSGADAGDLAGGSENVTITIYAIVKPTGTTTYYANAQNTSGNAITAKQLDPFGNSGGFGTSFDAIRLA